MVYSGIGGGERMLVIPKETCTRRRSAPGCGMLSGVHKTVTVSAPIYSFSSPYVNILCQTRYYATFSQVVKPLDSP
jgi:hypothetical protein